LRHFNSSPQQSILLIGFFLEKLCFAPQCGIFSETEGLDVGNKVLRQVKGKKSNLKPSILVYNFAVIQP
jgi:hypothetical protein